MLQNEYSLANMGFDTAENETSRACYKVSHPTITVPHDGSSTAGVVAMERSLCRADIYNRFEPFFLRAMKLMKKKTPDEKVKHFLQVSKAPSHPRPHHDRRTWAGVRVNMAKEMNLLKGDLVQVLYGKDKGKQAIIRHILHKKNQVIVHGCNMQRTFWHPKWKPKGPACLAAFLLKDLRWDITAMSS